MSDRAMIEPPYRPCTIIQHSDTSGTPVRCGFAHVYIFRMVLSLVEYRQATTIFCGAGPWENSIQRLQGHCSIRGLSACEHNERKPGHWNRRMTVFSDGGVSNVRMCFAGVVVVGSSRLKGHCMGLLSTILQYDCSPFLRRFRPHSSNSRFCSSHA